MNEQTITLIINGIVSLLAALPKIIEAINNMDIPEHTKEELIARIKVAQDSLPDWP